MQFAMRHPRRGQFLSYDCICEKGSDATNASTYLPELWSSQDACSAHQLYISATLFVFESDCTCCFRKHDGMKCDKYTGHLPQGPGIAPKPRQRFSLHLGLAGWNYAARWRCIRNTAQIAAKGGCQQHSLSGLQFSSIL